MEPTVFVRGFPSDTREDDLRQFFKSAGNICSVRIVRNYAFITFKKMQEAQNAVQNFNRKYFADTTWKMVVELVKKARQDRNGFRANHDGQDRRKTNGCFYCQKQGHKKFECPELRESSNPKRSTDYRKKRNQSKSSSSSCRSRSQSGSSQRSRQNKRKKKRSFSSESKSSTLSKSHQRHSRSYSSSNSRSSESSVKRSKKHKKNKKIKEKQNERKDRKRENIRKQKKQDRKKKRQYFSPSSKSSSRRSQRSSRSQQNPRKYMKEKQRNAKPKDSERFRQHSSSGKFQRKSANKTPQNEVDDGYASTNKSRRADSFSRSTNFRRKSLSRSESPRSSQRKQQKRGVNSRRKNSQSSSS